MLRSERCVIVLTLRWDSDKVCVWMDEACGWSQRWKGQELRLVFTHGSLKKICLSQPTKTVEEWIESSLNTEHSCRNGNRHTHSNIHISYITILPSFCLSSLTVSPAVITTPLLLSIFEWDLWSKISTAVMPFSVTDRWYGLAFGPQPERLQINTQAGSLSAFTERSVWLDAHKHSRARTASKPVWIGWHLQEQDLDVCNAAGGDIPRMQFLAYRSSVAAGWRSDGFPWLCWVDILSSLDKCQTSQTK